METKLNNIINTKIGNKIFDGISKQMLFDFEQIRSEITHKGERGAQQEETLIKFLSHYLPKKYGIGSGEIVNSHDQVSRQCDIVIYNVNESPLLLIREGYQLFPVESVVATIEVKSTINQRSVSEIITNIASIGSLFEKEAHSPFCTFFAYKSDYHGEDRSKKVAKSFSKFCKDLEPSNFFDQGCVLDTGLFYSLEIEKKGAIGFTITQNTPAQNLCSFFLSLLFALEQGNNYYLQKYFDYEAPYIDTVSF